MIKTYLIYLINHYKRDNSWLNLYRPSLFLSFFLKEGILNIPGNKYIANGYTNEREKLIKVSLIKIIWVFTKTAQKHEIKYQKNIINKKLIIKNIVNLIFNLDSIIFDFLYAS